MANDVYLITNVVNGKRYVGVTSKGYLFRFHQHIMESRDTIRHNSLLHQAMVKYGESAFSVQLIETGISDEDIKDKEKYYIRFYDTFYVNHHGYNMTEGGDGMSGYHHTEASKAQISKTLQGHKFPESRNHKIRQAMLGREYKPEWKAALSKTRKGRFAGANNSFYGKQHSASTKQKISDANSKHQILQYDLETSEVLREFKNFCEAARWVIDNNLSNALVSTCAARLRVVATSTNTLCSAYGYRWRIKEGQSTNSKVEDELLSEVQPSVDNTDKI